MPASYPSAVKSFTTKSNGGTIDASHVNDLQEEVTAVENDLVTGLPIARGGTGATAFAANRIPHMNAGNTALTSTSGLTFDGTTLTAPATTITQPLTISGASAGQIVFPASQNASTNVNTLDDYEEGSWTPVIGGAGGTSGQVYNFQTGKYVKIGKLVTAYFDVSMSTKGTITGNVQIQGLPFTSENTTNLRISGMVSFWNNTATAFVNLSLRGEPNATAVTILGATAATAAPTALATADLNNATDFVGCITYAATA